MEVDPRELLDSTGAAVHPRVPVTATGTLLMEAMPYLVDQPEQTHVQRRRAPELRTEAADPDSARVRRELDEMSMVLDAHAMSRRLATASDDEMARYLDSLRASQGLPPQAEVAAAPWPQPAGAPPPAPHWQVAPAPVRAHAAQAQFDPIAQRFTPPPGLEAEHTQPPQSAFAQGQAAVHQHAHYPPPGMPAHGHAAAFAPHAHAQAFGPQAHAPHAFSPPPAYAAHPQAPYRASYAPSGPFAPPPGGPGSPFALPPSQRRPALASPAPPSQMPPSIAPVVSSPKRNGSTAMFALMFVVALVGVGAVTYVALRTGPQGAVTGPLTSLRVADAT
jgi:hypothetical protein